MMMLDEWIAFKVPFQQNKKRPTTTTSYRINIFCSVIILLLWFSLPGNCVTLLDCLFKNGLTRDKKWKQIVTQCWIQFNWLLWNVEFVAYLFGLSGVFEVPTDRAPHFFINFHLIILKNVKVENWIFHAGKGKHTDTQTHICGDSDLGTRYSKHSICLGNKFICIYFQSSYRTPFAHQTNRKTILSPLFGWIHFAEFVTMANCMTLMSSRTTAWIEVKMKSMKEKKDETFFRDLLEIPVHICIYMAASEREKKRKPYNSSEFEFLISEFLFCFSD